ncbi:hypothetical protein [Massilia eurypsychrophila]|jgi:hypothetical protein|nr:hypothetical protein [Massilia eurypsychrophila]
MLLLEPTRFSLPAPALELLRLVPPLELLLVLLASALLPPSVLPAF